MFRKLFTIALSLLIFAVFGRPAAAITVFGPHVFERQTGKPVIETADFTNPAASSDFVIKIVNGDSRGKRRVSAATVTLDGNPVCGPSDFNQQVAELEHTVALGRTARLAVITEGAPGGFITVTITGTSSQPSVTLNASPLAITAGESALLTWKAVNAASCSITPEIGDVALSGSLTVTPFATTTYTITATGPLYHNGNRPTRKRHGFRNRTGYPTRTHGKHIGHAGCDYRRTVVSPDLVIFPCRGGKYPTWHR